MYNMYEDEEQQHYAQEPRTRFFAGFVSGVVACAVAAAVLIFILSNGTSLSSLFNRQKQSADSTAPAQTLACKYTSDKSFCDGYHALDAAYAAKLHYWTTPQTQCVDGSGNNCTDYSEWVTKWQEIKG